MKFRVLFCVISWLVVASLAEAAVVRPGPSRAAQQQAEEQSPPPVEETITVTANRLSEAADGVASTVTVITSEEIELSGARWISDVLEWAPGVSVARSGGPGKVTSAFVRGTNSNHTLVLINGVKVNSPTTGAYSFANLPATHIERIEIVRGPQSSLYGSEAIGGVINIFTKRGAGPAAAGFELAGGSLSTGYANGWAGGQSGSLEYSASLLYFNSGSFSAASEGRGNPERDGTDNVTADGRLGYRFSDELRIDGFVRLLDAFTEIDGFTFGVGPSDDDNAEQTTRDLHAGVTVARRGQLWETSLTAATSELELESLNPDAAFFLGSRLDAHVRELDWENRVRIADGQTLIGGIEYRREGAVNESKLVSGPSGFDESVDVVGLYLHDRVELADVATLTFGGRHEDHSSFGGHTTFRLSGVAEVKPGLRVHGSLGTGFRAPSLNDLFFPFFGNLDLQPEESTGFDIGVTGVWPRVRLEATFFDNRFDNLIAFSPAINAAENIGKASARGTELAGEWDAAVNVRVGGGYTYTRARDEDLDVPLLRRPRHQGSVRLTLRPHRLLRVFTELRAKGERADSGPAGPLVVDGYTLWNASADLELTANWSLTGRLENILDEDYEEVFGFGAPPFGAYVGIRAKVGGTR